MARTFKKSDFTRYAGSPGFTMGDSDTMVGFDLVAQP